jgi:hypothetical protein
METKKNVKTSKHKIINSNVIINNNTYKIIKQIGQGMFGTVYLVSHNNINYAYKIEHILPSDYIDYKNNKHCKIKTEIDFCIKIANKNPNHFIELKDYDFIKDCNHKQKYAYKLSLKTSGKKIVKQYANLAKSPYCSRKIYTLIDTSLDSLKKFNNNKFSHEQIYSMLVQIYYCLYIMHSNDYIHNDFHPGNIGVVNTKEKYITILNKKIPTYKRIYKAIDYGNIMYLSNLKLKQLKVNFENFKNSEIRDIKNLLVDYKYMKIQKFFIKHKIQPKDFTIAYEDFKKLDEYKIISKYTDDSNLQLFLLNMIYPEIYKNIMFTKKFKTNIQQKLILPIEDIIFIIQSDTNLLKLINYFINKITFSSNL